jgi:hypothetical protein
VDLGQDAEARVIVCYTLCHCFHRGFEIFVGRIDEKPLSQNLMRHQRREFGLNGSVIFVVRTHQNPVPVPAPGFRWLNEQQHLALEEVRGKPTEHSLGEEGRVLDKRLENPLVFERFHVFESTICRGRRGSRLSRARRRRPVPAVPSGVNVTR